jgi:hypothetical protein
MKDREHSDAAKRVYDTYHLHRTADLHGGLGKWFACALNDGATDGVLYENKSDAIRHQHHNEQYYAFIQVTYANMTRCTAEVFLKVNRRLYDAGIRMADPAAKGGGKELIRRASTEDQLAYLRGKSQNVTLSPN